MMHGEIVPGDYQRLLKYVVENDIDLTGEQIILSSLGGDVTEALRLGQLIKSLYRNVYVFSWSGPCASACFVLYSSAVERLANSGVVGIHRPYISPSRVQSLSPSEAEHLETRALTEAEAYLHKLGVPNSLVDAMFEKAPSEIYWLSDDEILNQLGRRAPWYEEFLIARCGLRKDAELDGTDSGEDGNSAEIKVLQCGMNLTHQEAVRNFSRALAPLHTGFRDDRDFYGFYALSPPGPTT